MTTSIHYQTGHLSTTDPELEPPIEIIVHPSGACEAVTLLEEHDCESTSYASLYELCRTYGLSEKQVLRCPVL